MSLKAEAIPPVPEATAEIARAAFPQGNIYIQMRAVPTIQQDHHAVTTIQASLAANQLLPAHQWVDAGHISAKRILHSHDRQRIELVGPVHINPSR